jgi:hypothetical protein
VLKAHKVLLEEGVLALQEPVALQELAVYLELVV